MGSRYNLVISFIKGDPVEGVTRVTYKNCDFDFIAEGRMIYVNLFKGDTVVQQEYFPVSNIFNLEVTRLR